MGEIVKYHNDVHSASLRNFNAVELDIFMTILNRMRDKDEEEIVFSFDELKKLVKWTGKSNKEFASALDRTYNKLIECNIKLETEEQLIRFVLFTRYAISKTKSEIAIKVNPDFKLLLNSLLSNFTRFELGEFISLKSSYTKEFYRRMKQFRSTGVWIVSLQEFKRLLDIPRKYDIDSINKRVLVPIMEELGVKYQLKITKQYDKTGRGRPSVSGFRFDFLKEGGHDGSAAALSIPADAPAPKNVQKNPPARKKRLAVDAEINEASYLGRTVKLKDKQYEKYNFLKIKGVGYDPETGKVRVAVQNMDDSYGNTLVFDDVEAWDNFFKKYLI